jgi:hypothetical protein
MPALLWPAQPALADFVQENKVVGGGAVGAGQRGFSVALSGDGTTALVGGPYSNSSAGAAWVFKRASAGTSAWTQQAQLLCGNAIGNAECGFAVSLSADGNTALVGGDADNNFLGAAWIFTRSGSVWTQQAKLVPVGAIGAPKTGWSVALSADGNTAITGGHHDNNDVGAVWTWTRSGSAWSQSGNKLVASNPVGAALQGYSVALSADGNIAMVGGPVDNSSIGAAWIFVQPNITKLVPTATHDLDANDYSDIAWRHSGGAVGAWMMAGQFVHRRARLDDPGPQRGLRPQARS